MTRVKELTIMIEVPPGDKTGVYYIPVCSLPFGTTWSPLRDWISSVCAVDHIAIFLSGTSGWVRVLGQENFSKAFDLLDGGEFNGRRVVASDRNKIHSIKIKRLVRTSSNQKSSIKPPPPSHCSLPISAAMLRRDSIASAHQYYMGGPSNSPIAGSSYNGESSISPTRGMPTPYASTNIGDNHELVPSVPSSSPCPGHDGSQPTLPYRGKSDQAFYGTMSPENAQRVAAALAGHSPKYPSNYCTPGGRRLFISPFSPQTSVEVVTTWIQQKAGSLANDIDAIDVPREGTDMCIRGYANVHFRNTAAAHKAMDVFFGAELEGRILITRVLAETTFSRVPAIPRGPRALMGSRNGKSHRSNPRESDQAQSSAHNPHLRRLFDEMHLSSSHDNSSSSSKMGTPSPSPDTKMSSPECEYCKESSPVIADGTSCQR